jgi:RHS repeat-associated protein
MSEPGELLVEGLPLGDDTTASKGALTLVGLPGMQALAPEEFADRDPDVRAVHAYLGDELGWRSWHKNAPGYLNTLRIMNPGRGYWIESNAPVLSAAMSGGPSVPTFYHADHLGSTNLNTNPAGELQAELAYYPFGMPRYDHAARRTPMFGPFYDFADKERDPETLLQYFEARFCSDRLGRFLSVDPLALRAAPSAPQSPQKTHPYAYAMNNPLRLIDPDGHEPKDKVSFASQVMDMFGAATDFAKEIVQASPKPTQAHPMLVPVAPKLGPAAKAATAFTETLKPVAPVLKVVGQGLGLLGAGMGSYDATKGIINKDPEKVVGGVADTVAAGVGLLGGTVGAAGAGGYAGGTLLAGQIDKHTGHFQRSTAAGHRAEAAMTKATGNETVGTVFGAATAGMETLLPGSSASSVAVLEWIND